MIRLDKNFNFVIVGGGTAGWITALYLEKYFPETNITVVASTEIGILGAGEGTTPHFLNLLDEIGISVVDLIKHADATFKNGIKFTNWNGDNTHYYHPFKDNDDLDHTLYSDLNYSDIPLMDLELMASNKNLDSIDFSSFAAESNKVRYTADSHVYSKQGDPFRFFNSLGLHALHFNANKLANYLQNVAILRGIKLIDAIVKNIDNDENGYIKKINLDKGYGLDTDFVIDCTGFKRLIIGDHFKSPWTSYTEYLPVNKAIPFFLPIETETIPSYTEATAMKHGWMWKIPVGDRYGCGYVFNSDCTNEDNAKHEIETYLNKKIDVPRSFNFDAGCFKNQWIKNCVAIGLSSGFIEPLEATSIWVSIQSLHCLLENISGITQKSETSIKKYNEKLNYINDKILEFVHFHYLSKRNDSSFWNNFKNVKHPEFINELIDVCKYEIPKKSFFNKNYVFQHKSYYAVGAGIQFFDQNLAIQEFNSLTQGIRSTYYRNFKSNYLKNLEINKTNLLDHSSFIELLKKL
jgi:tryptophan halogenase